MLFRQRIGVWFVERQRSVHDRIEMQFSYYLIAKEKCENINL